jgi:Leucine-rich repeat (LRR) protein
MEDNQVADLSPLTGLTELQQVNFDRNLVSDLTGLEGLPVLSHVFLNGNLVTDISLLVANTGLGSGDKIDLMGNPLSSPQACTDVETLRSRGATVYEDTCP